MKLMNIANHCDLYAAKKRKNTKILYESDSSILMLDQDMPCLFLSCENTDEMNEIMKCIDLNQKLTVTLHQKELIPFFIGYHVYLKCVNALYHESEINVISPKYPVRQLNKNDIRQASLLYRKQEHNVYVEHCILKGVCYGMFDGDKLIGMIGEHDEEMMGLLESHPDYRRKGLAMALETFMMKVQNDKGKLVSAQIETDNAASLALHRKLGFEIGDELVYWLRVHRR